MRVAVAGGTGLTGRAVVGALEAAGHDAVALSRGTGVDLTTGRGLDRALDGADAVVDVSDLKTMSRRRGEEFFGAVSRTLLDAERRAGIGHHVVLSISRRAPLLRGQGPAGERGAHGRPPVDGTARHPAHEFALQTLARSPGPVLAPRMLSRPVAVREVGDALAGLAVGGPRAGCSSWAVRGTSRSSP